MEPELPTSPPDPKHQHEVRSFATLRIPHRVDKVIELFEDNGWLWVKSERTGEYIEHVFTKEVAYDSEDDLADEVSKDLWAFLNPHARIVEDYGLH